MKYLHHGQMLLRMSVLLGLCATGCQTGARIGGSFSGGASWRVQKPAVELQKPYVSSSVETANAEAKTPSPIVRTAADEETPVTAGAVVASSWRALPRPTAVDTPTLSEPPLAAISSPRILRMPAASTTEKLPAPRKSGTVVSTQVTMAPTKSAAMVGSKGMAHHGGHGVHGEPIMPMHHVPSELSKIPLPAYVVEPPDVLLIQLLKPAEGQPATIVDGPHLVRPDGTVNLGVLGSLPVAGLTVDQIRTRVIEHLRKNNITDYEVKKDGMVLAKVPLEKLVVVDVIEYRSKFYYVIADGGGSGEQVIPVPVTGPDTVLDALAKVGGLPPQASKKRIWIARTDPQYPGGKQLLAVDWNALAQRGDPHTNYQLFPNDRLYVQSDARIRMNTQIEKSLNPIDRIFGTVLLGSTTVNSINGNRGGNRN